MVDEAWDLIYRLAFHRRVILGRGNPIVIRPLERVGWAQVYLRLALVYNVRHAPDNARESEIAEIFIAGTAFLFQELVLNIDDDLVASAICLNGVGHDCYVCFFFWDRNFFRKLGKGTKIEKRFYEEKRMNKRILVDRMCCVAVGAWSRRCCVFETVLLCGEENPGDGGKNPGLYIDLS